MDYPQETARATRGREARVLGGPSPEEPDTAPCGPKNGKVHTEPVSQNAPQRSLAGEAAPGVPALAQSLAPAPWPPPCI